MRRCENCGFLTEGASLTCPLCGQRLPMSWNFNDNLMRRIGLTILIPILVWIVMTRVLKL